MGTKPMCMYVLYSERDFLTYAVTMFFFASCLPVGLSCSKTESYPGRYVVLFSPMEDPCLVDDRVCSRFGFQLMHLVHVVSYM